MTTPADLIVFGEDWGRHPSSTQHIVKCLARNRRVLWVNSIGMRRPRLSLADAGRIASKVGAALGRRGTHAARDNLINGIPARPDNLDVLSPFAVSWPASRIAFAANRQLLAGQLRKAMAARGINRPVVWTSLPSALPVVGTLGERAVVYYCGDDFGSLVGVDHAPILAMERQLVEQADLVIAASANLANRFPPHKTLLLPHGTDLDHFAVPVPRARDLPDAEKVAGFYGSIDDRLDLDMLIRTARQLGDWQFVLIGPVQTDVSSLSGIANIHVLGPRPYEALPGYVQHWQVSMILYRVDEQVRAGNPLKLREYLAAGTPIASIAVPALEPYAGIVAISAGPAEFATAVMAASADHERNDLRRAAVAGESWEARAREVAERLEALCD